MPKPLIILFVSLFSTSATKQRIESRKHSVSLWGSGHNLDAVALPCENELARKARPEIASFDGYVASLENWMEVIA